MVYTLSQPPKNPVIVSNSNLFRQFSRDGVDKKFQRNAVSFSVRLQ